MESPCQAAKKHEVELPAISSTSTNQTIVSLARAVYSRASVLLLDDVLSAGEWLYVIFSPIANLYSS